MPRIVNTTLIGDGRSDRVLVPIIELLLKEHCPVLFRAPDFVDDYPAGTSSLTDRVRHGLSMFPCDVLFVHRDAEQRDGSPKREAEILTAVSGLSAPPPVVAVVPVRMTEAWLLTDEHAIRCAAGNPNGRTPLSLPQTRQVESIDAKAVLFDALVKARDLSSRRGVRVQPEALRHRVADYIDDLTSLRKLPSFLAFEGRLRAVFQSMKFADA